MKRVELNRWPTGYADCIRTRGLREGSCDHNLQGDQRDRGMDRGPGEAVRASGGPREMRGNQVVAPPHIAGWKHEGHAARDGRTHEVSRAGTGRWPGRKTATTRRRPACHAGHCPMSTPIYWNRRAATASGAGGAFRGNAARNCPEAVGFARSARLPAKRSAPRSKARRSPAIPSADAGLPQVQQVDSGGCSHWKLDILGSPITEICS